MAKPIKCGSTNCPLYGSQIVPYDGNKEAHIVVVGESPGRMELVKGKPFQGDSGDLLKAVSKEVGLNYQKLFIANACRCQVKKDEMSAKQIKAAIDACRGKLAKALELLKPKAIIVLGDIALKAVLKKSGITKARGSWIWSTEFNCWVLPTFHPAYILRNMGLRAILKGDLLRVQEFVKNNYEPLAQEKTDSEGYGEVDSLDFLLPKKGQKIVIGLDTETQGIDWTSPNFVLISASLSDGMGKAYQCILHKECEKGSHDFSITWPRRVEGKKKTENVEVFIRRAHNFIIKVNGLRKILESDNVKKFMANGNFDRHAFDHLWKALGKKPPKLKGYIMDIQAGAHVLDENIYKMASLQDLQFAMTDTRVDYKQDFEKNFDKSDMLAVLRDHPEEFNYYSMSDADVTRQVGLHIATQLNRPENAKLLRYFTKMVMPGLNVLKVLETNGALIDAEQLPKVTKTVTALVDATQKEALATLPPKLLKAHEDKGLRLTRDDLVRDALFSPQGFKLPGIKRTKGNDAWSVDKETRILLLDHPGLSEKARLFIHKYDEFSESHTMLTRYLRGFDKAIKTDGRIHSSYSLTVAVTGRVASRQPNMQNNPKRSTQASQIRRLIKARKGYKLLAIDQGQAELRWAAHLSGDPEMLRIFKGNFDIHTETAMDLGQHTKASWQTISKKEQDDLRRKAKCFHPDTDVLTPSGWKAMRILTPGELVYQAIPSNGTVSLSLTPVSISFKKNNPNYLVALKNEGMDLLVTTDHRMLGQRETGQFFVTNPESFKNVRYWWNAGIHMAGFDMDNHTLLRLAIATQADGSYTKYGGIRFGFSKDRKVKRLRRLLIAANISFSESHHANRVTTFYIKKDASLHIRELLDPNKTLPWAFLHLGLEERIVILEEASFWDARKQANWKMYQYLSSVEKNIDVLQAIAATSGFKTRKTGSTLLGKYCLSIKRASRTRGGNLTCHTPSYTGDVAVVSVPSTFILVRRGGIPVITGQSANFGLLYKMSAPGFVRYAKKDYGLDLSIEEAEIWIRTFFGKYPKLLDYHQRMINFCRQHGYVESPLGRRRRLPEIYSKNPGLRNEAERQAVNAPIQSVSSDVVLLAADEIEKKEYDSVDVIDCLVVHDELVFEIRDCSKLVDYAADIKKEMEHPPLYKKFGVKLRVPLVADIKIGDNLAEMTALEI